MEVEPLWETTCRLIFFAGGLALTLLLTAYWWGGTDNPNLPFTSATAGLILKYGGATLLLFVLYRWFRESDADLDELLSFLMWWD